MNIDFTDIDTIAALAGIIGILPILYAVIKYTRNRLAKPIIIKLKEGKMMRGNGDDWLTLNAELSLKSNNGKDLTVHKLYPLVCVSGEYKTIDEVLVNGVKLNKDGSSNMLQGITIEKDKTYLISFRSLYDINFNSDFKNNLSLNIDYTLNNKDYRAAFDLTYHYFG